MLNEPFYKNIPTRNKYLLTYIISANFFYKNIENQYYYNIQLPAATNIANPKANNIIMRDIVDF